MTIMRSTRSWASWLLCCRCRGLPVLLAHRGLSARRVLLVLPALKGRRVCRVRLVLPVLLVQLAPRGLPVRKAIRASRAIRVRVV